MTAAKDVRDAIATEGERRLEIDGHAVVLQWTMQTYDRLFQQFGTDDWAEWRKMIMGGRPDNLKLGGSAVTIEGDFAELMAAVKTPADIVKVRDNVLATALGLPVEPDGAKLPEAGDEATDEPGKLPKAG